MNTEKESVSVDNFLENFKSKNKNVPLRNLYIFRVKDKDDNLVEERYGVNIVVRNGYSQVPFTSAYELVVGTGTGEYSYSRTSLFNQVGTSVSGSYEDSVYPVYYDSKRDLICQYFELATYTLDYTFANKTFDITEFGIYSSSNGGLLTHGQVLDSSGSPSHITKNLYDKMKIEVRWLYVMSPEINRRLINLGIYGLLGIAQSISNGFYGIYYANIYQPSNSSYPYEYSSSYQAFSTNSQVKSLREWSHAPALLCEDRHLCISDFVCHSSGYGSNATVNRGFLIVPIYTDPEELTSDIIYCDTHLTPDFGYMFQSIYKKKYDSNNLRGQFPVTNFEILSSYMYNHYTHQWDIEDQTTNCGNSDFRPTTWQWSLQLWINDPNGVSKYVYITVNPTPSIQITSFDTSGIVVYATDEWWDNRTWILITDLNHLTYEQGTKRYYIKESDKIIYPTRNQEYPKFLYDRNYHWSTQVYDQNTSSTTAIAVCCSDQYELYCSENYMFFHPEGLPGGYDDQTACVQKTLVFTWPDSVVGGSKATPHISRTDRHIFNDKLVVCSEWYRSGSSSWSTNTSGTHIRILDIGDPAVNMDPNADIPYVDMQLEFTNKTYNTAGTISHRWDGDYWISYESNAKELICVKLHGGPNEDTPTQFTIDTGIEFWDFDYGTNHIIYRKTDDTLLYHYYDLDAQTDVNTFDITEFDSTVSTMNNITGYNGIIYITAQYPNSSDKYTYFYDTATGEWKVDKTFYSDALHHGWICGYNDECAVYIQNGAYNSIITIIDASDPYHFIHSPNYITTDGMDQVSICACQLKYANNGKQLLLSVPCYYHAYSYDFHRNYVLDIGRILDEKKFYALPYDNLDLYISNYMSYQNCMYKDTVIYRGSGTQSSNKAYINLVPIAQFVPHKVTISTRTLTAYNNPFRVSSTNMLQILESTTLSRLTADPVDITTYSPAILYRVDMFEGLTLSHRFVPCIRDADQMKGLFDVVAQEFLEPFDNAATTVDSTTAITTDYMLPSGYTQVYSIGCAGSLPNWITTDQMTHPVFHTANTKIEWYGKVSSSSKTWICLFGSKEFENEAAHFFAFYSKNGNGSFAYRRGSKTYYYKTDASLSKYDVDLKIVCDGLTASWYLMSDLTNPVATITISEGTLDDGVVPMTFMACGLTNGRDYSAIP